MSAATFLAGLGWFCATTVATAVAAWFVTRRAFGALRGTERVLAFALVLTAGLVGVHLVAGALGLLARGTVAVLALVTLAAAVAWDRRAGRTPVAASPAPAPPPSGRASWVLAAAALGLVALYLVAFLVETRMRTTSGIDALVFQLPGIGRWIQDGSIWPIHHFAHGWAFGNYPANGELVQLSTMLPWRTDAFLRITAVAYLLVAGAAAYALARELRAPRAAAAAAAAVVVALPASLVTAAELVKPDSIMLACFLAGVAFLVRHARTGATSDLVLAALGLGLGFGTKWYGVAFAVAALGVWVAARLVVRRPVGEVVRQAALAGGIVAASGGFWLVRNLVGSGNPVFPVRISAFGVTLFDAPPDRQRELAGFSLADYATDPAVWERYILPALRESFAVGGALAAAALIAGLVAGVRARRVVLAAVALTGLVLLGLYAILPYTAQGLEGEPILVSGATRYAAPGLALGAAVAAACARPLGRWAVVVPLLALVAVLDSLRQLGEVGIPREVAPLRGGSLVLAVVALAAVAVAAVALRRRPVPRPALVGAGAAAAVLAAGGAFVQLDRYVPTRFQGADPSLDYVLARAPADHRIGILGTVDTRQIAPTWPAFGPRLDNHVDMLGRVEREVLRPLRDRDELARVLREQSYDLLYVLRDEPAGVAPEERWARSLGWRPVARGRRSSVLAPRR